MPPRHHEIRAPLSVGDQPGNASLGSFGDTAEANASESEQR
jgi:hypothetical protein